MIKEFEKQDESAVLSIWLEASLIAHDFIPAYYWKEKSEDLLSRYLPSSKTFVYVNDKTREVEGFMSLVENYIAALFVKPNLQGKGIGSQFISYAKGKHNTLQLKVYARNIKAVNFYEKHGFSTIDCNVEESTGETEILMTFTK